MNIQVEKINIKDKDILSNLLHLYSYELSKNFFPHLSLNEMSSSAYLHLDDYWEKDECIPYFIKLESEIVGFILINKDFKLLPKENNSYNVSELFVLDQYKRKGIGKNAIFQVFKNHIGKWEVIPASNSISAEVFWKKIIKEYMHNNYNEKP